MRTTLSTLVILAGVLVCSPTEAADVGVTAKIGTLGYGADVTVTLMPRLNLRAGVALFDYDFEEDAEEGEAVEVQVGLDWQTVSLLVDWHLWEGGFRASGGLILNNNEIVASADPNDLVEIGNGEYIVSSLSGEITFPEVVPYLGIGYGNAAGEGHWHFAFDLGVMFQGTPDVELRATAANPFLQSAVNADLAIEKADLEEDVESFTLYPVLSLGLSYTF